MSISLCEAFVYRKKIYLFFTKIGFPCGRSARRRLFGAFLLESPPPSSTPFSLAGGRASGVKRGGGTPRALTDQGDRAGSAPIGTPAAQPKQGAKGPRLERIEAKITSMCDPEK